jgi:ribosome recycling factor
MLKTIQQTTQVRMQKTGKALEEELSKLRAGRAHPNLLDSVQVNYHGSQTPLSQVASINVEGALMLTVKVWDKSLTPEVEKAIRSSDLGLNPVGAGDVIRVPLPPLSEERRRDLIKHVKRDGEEAKVAVRNIRRDANHEAKELLKSKTVSEDEARRAEEEIQKLTNKFITQIDTVLAKKEKDLLSI